MRQNEREREGDREITRQRKKETDIRTGRWRTRRKQIDKIKARIGYREREAERYRRRGRNRENFELYFNTDIQITEAQTVICQTDIPRKMSVWEWLTNVL
jgi:hypothetical protein